MCLKFYPYLYCTGQLALWLRSALDFLEICNWHLGKVERKKNLNLRKLLIVSVYIKISLLMLLSLKHEMFLTFTVIVIHWEDKCMAILNFLSPYSLCKQVVSLRHMTFCNHWSK